MSRAAHSAGNLPSELTSFVGRRRDLAQIRRLLASARLVTLSGPGGVGKTRLALRAAAQVRRAFPDGVWFVALAELRDPALLPTTLATTLGLVDGVGEPVARLAEYLADKQLLLVWDNCEHLLDAVAALAGKLLSATSGVRVLATSRQVLRADGEQVLTISPLAVTSDRDPGAMEAVTLFAERATALQPAFRLDETNWDSVVRICNRLDGIPLAIELAAVRLRALSPDQILQRMDDRFRLLTTGGRTAPSRQQTLEAALEWSFELCTAAERSAWAALSVFRGSFDLEAAEAVCAGLGIGAGEVLDLVAGLVDKSILSRLDGTHGRDAWYSMLDTMREYGHAQLANTGREDTVRARHTGYYAQLAQRFRRENFSPHQLEWIERLRRELPNLRAALEYCIAHPDRGHRPAEIAAPLLTFWVAGGFLVEGDRWLRAALASEPEPTTLRADALRADMHLAVGIGDLDRAGQLLAELRELTAALDDDLLRFQYARLAGRAALYGGDLETAASLLTTAAEGFRQTGDQFALSVVLVNLSMALFYLDDPAGETVANEALALCEFHRAAWSRNQALWAVAINAWRHGDYPRSMAMLREVIAMRLSDYKLVGLALSGLAWCAGALGRHEWAAGLLGAARAVLHVSGSRIADANPYLAFDEQCGHAAREALGTEAFDQAFAATSRLGVEEAIAYALAEEKKTPLARPGKRSLGDAPGGLTGREHDVAKLIAEGLGNKQIAAQLVISQRTAETHVQNILAKLGFTSRTQIATWLTQHRTTGGNET